ncbi:MAG: AarF/ABC1/UbiB kinase family protein [Myxococcales bacterium]|nr:AarF/ABC1/UbiB kinase family protein [Myxococcales bacterium]
MLKKKWIPTPLVTERRRPVIAPIRPPSRFRSLVLAWTLSVAAARLLWMRMRRDPDTVKRSLIVRGVLERLGGMWIKVGQLLGMRRDLFSPEFCDVLAGLQDQANGFAFEYTRRTIEDDLGHPIDQIFSEFEESPFAAASIGQIHRAVLRREGVAVAVKIRRPTIAATMAGDIRFVTSLCNWAVRLRLFPSMRWGDFQRELDRTLSEEVDYRYEATAIRDMRRNLKRHGIYAPRVFRRYLSERVLVMEFVRGALMSDVLRLEHEDPQRLEAWLTENDIQRRKLGRRLFMSLARQLYEDNYFHGDLHPGNIVLLRGSRIALIDFGSVGWLEADFLSRYNEMQKALGTQQYAKAADLFLLLGPELPPTGVDEAKEELIVFMRNWALRARTPKISFSLKSIGHAYSAMAQTVARYRIPATWSFLRVNRAQLTLDTSLRALTPEMDYFALIRAYNRKAAQRQMRASLAPEALGKQVAELVTEVPKIVRGAVEESFYDLEYLRRRARQVQGTLDRAAMVGSMMATALALGMVVLGSGLVLLYLHQSGVKLPISPQLDATLASADPIAPEVWWLILGGMLVTLIQTWRMRARLHNPILRVKRR